MFGGNKMEKAKLQVLVNEMKGSDKVNTLINYMVDKGYAPDTYMNLKKADKGALEALEKFFSGEIAVDGMVVNGNNNVLNMEDVSKAKNKSNRGKGKNKKGEDNKVELKVIKPEENPSLENNAEGDSKGNDNIVDTNIENKSEGNNQENQNNNEAGDNNQAGDNQNNQSGQDGQNNQGNTGDQSSDTNKGETKSQIAKKYKTVHNLVFDAKAKHTVLENVREVTNTGEDNILSMELSGSELATMFLSGVLVYDPSMQRGLKEDNHGVMIANFKEYHVREIYESMKDNTFTPTQIHLAVITDDKLEDDTFEWHFNQDTNQLSVVGKIRLVDGQHRTRALARILNELKTGKLKDVDIDKYVFNVQIHVTNSEYARIIYRNIDKNLKLDKSQARQLSADYYARIVNALNQHSDSPLKGMIATSKPVGSKLVLFNNIADAIQESITITSNYQRDEEMKYLKEFFDYVAYKFPNGAFNDEKKMVEFRKNNLLVENNAFKMWVKVAMLDKVNYKKNIETLIANAEYFNKDHQGTVVIDNVAKTGHIWHLLNTVKTKQKGEGFAMNNTNTGINAITNQAIEMLGLGGDKK